MGIRLQARDANSCYGTISAGLEGSSCKQDKFQSMSVEGLSCKQDVHDGIPTFFGYRN